MFYRPLGACPVPTVAEIARPAAPGGPVDKPRGGTFNRGGAVWHKPNPYRPGGGRPGAVRVEGRPQSLCKHVHPSTSNRTSVRSRRRTQHMVKLGTRCRASLSTRPGSRSAASSTLGPPGRAGRRPVRQGRGPQGGALRSRASTCKSFAPDLLRLRVAGPCEPARAGSFRPQGSGLPAACAAAPFQSFGQHPLASCGSLRLTSAFGRIPSLAPQMLAHSFCFLQRSRDRGAHVQCSPWPTWPGWCAQGAPGLQSL